MIVTACDKNYLSEAEILIKSCARHAPDQKLYLYLVEGTSEHASLVQTWHPNVIVECAEWPYNGIKPGMMYCLRSIPLKSVLEEYGEPTIYFDSDIILRSSLGGFFEILKGCDAMVRYHPDLNYVGAAGTPHGATFNNGVIALNASAGGIRLAQEYDQTLKEYLASGKALTTYNSELNMKFVIDQELLYVTFERIKNSVVFEPLPMIYNDARFSYNSVVWHGKGAARKHPTFVIEQKRYRSELSYYLLGFANWVFWNLRQLRKHL